MNDEEPRLGLPYHRQYLDPGPAQERIAQKVRFRLHKLLRATFEVHPLCEYLEAEIGIKVQWVGNGGRHLEGYIEALSDLEVLHLVNVAARHAIGLDGNRAGNIRTRKQGAWVEGVRRIFQEENIAYRLDEMGGVHPLIDTAFTAEVEAVIEGLGRPRYHNVRIELEKGLKAIDQPQQDWKAAVRGTFYAAEGMFRLMFKELEPERLVPKYVRTNLDPFGKAIEDKNEREAFLSLVSIFQSWVGAAQEYRHEQGIEEPHQPPRDIALLLVSQGLSYLRWLVALDSRG